MATATYTAVPVVAVDDEAHALRSVELVLRSGGVDNCICLQDSRKVLPLLGRLTGAVVLLDLSMPHLSGEDLLAQITQNHPDVPVIVVTAANALETAVQCMRAGAFDYMVKPVEGSRLLSGVQRALELCELRQQNALLRNRIFTDQLEHPEAFAAIVTQDPGMYAMFKYMETVAPTPRPVLITGETGVGKELVARGLHALSGRPGVFIARNMAGLDDTMFSDTLFGHAKGAFTGAETARPGMVEQAAHGTLFLDEIGDLNEAAQIKLLRLLQEQEYFPLGSDIPKHSSARIIAATNRDLQALQAQGAFRKDLYYRLSTHRVEVPPLRDRLGDLPVLLDHFLGQAADTLGKPKPTPPPALVQLLSMHAYPGNIRELEGLVFEAVSKHRSHVLSMDVFKAHIQSSLPKEKTIAFNTLSNAAEPAYPFAGLETLPTLKESSQLLIHEALRRSQGNQSLAAQMLGITQSALSKRLHSPAAD